MNHPWNDANWPAPKYSSYHAFKDIIDQPVEYKYSEILFCGSCDMWGYREDKYWHEILCERKNLNHDDYVFIGAVGQTFAALVRKIYVYLKKTATPPKTMLMVVPAITQEHLINGVCYSLHYNPKITEYLINTGLVPNSDIEIIRALQAGYNKSITQEERIYSFCKEFSIIELLCKIHGIKLYWTTNQTNTAHYHFRNLSDCLMAHEFANETFIGTLDPQEIGYAENNSPTSTAHRLLANLFISALEK